MDFTQLVEAEADGKRTLTELENLQKKQQSIKEDLKKTNAGKYETSHVVLKYSLQVQ